MWLTCATRTGIIFSPSEYFSIDCCDSSFDATVTLTFQHFGGFFVALTRSFLYKVSTSTLNDELLTLIWKVDLVRVFQKKINLNFWYYLQISWFYFHFGEKHALFDFKAKMTSEALQDVKCDLGLLIPSLLMLSQDLVQLATLFTFLGSSNSPLSHSFFTSSIIFNGIFFSSDHKKAKIKVKKNLDKEWLNFERISWIPRIGYSRHADYLLNLPIHVLIFSNPRNSRMALRYFC